MKRLASMVAVAAIVTACGSGSTAAAVTGTFSIPRQVIERSPLPSCGTENATRHLGPWNAQARRCFWDAYQRGRPAEFVSTRLTIEGDPVTTFYRILGPGRIEVFEDLRRDMDAGIWIRLDCQTLAEVDSPTMGADFGPDESCVPMTIS